MKRMIHLGDQDFPLRYTVNSLCTLEEVTGYGLDQLLKTSFSAVRGLLWCGLMEARPDLSLVEVGNLLEGHLKEGGSLGRVASILSQALEEAGFFHLGRGEKDPPSPCGSNT